MKWYQNDPYILRYFNLHICNNIIQAKSYSSIIYMVKIHDYQSFLFIDLLTFRSEANI